MPLYHADPEKLAAPRPSVTPELLELVQERYGLRMPDAPRDLGGSFSLNLLANGFVVRVYGPWVSADRVAEIQRVRAAVRNSSIPVPELRATLDGDVWCVHGDCVIEVERFIEGEPMETHEQTLVGMRLLGRLHSQMEDLEVMVPPPIANHLPESTAIEATLAATTVVRSWGPTAAEERYAKSAEELARMLTVVGLPEQVVHGDFKDNNVLFRGTEVVGVLDFDFTGVRPRIDDLALPIHYKLQIGGRLADAREWVDAYDVGLRRPLTSVERAAFPFAMARMPLAHLSHLVIMGAAGRREFNETRGPACEWWLNQMKEAERWQRAFA